MGTEIQLTIGNVSLDYAKNFMGNDYGFLFQEADLARRRSDAINYEYYEEHPDEASDLLVSELGFVRPLARIRPRLCLLGHTLEGARAEYQAVVEEAASVAEFIVATEDAKPLLNFEEFCALANLY